MDKSELNYGYYLQNELVWFSGCSVGVSRSIAADIYEFLGGLCEIFIFVADYRIASVHMQVVLQQAEAPIRKIVLHPVSREYGDVSVGLCEVDQHQVIQI